MKNDFKEKKISIIIPVYNGFDVLKLCLESMKNIEYINYEVIVVDDCSTDSPDYSIQDFGGFVLRNKHRLGPAISRLEGAKVATGEVVAFIDADCRPYKDWLKKVNCFLTKDVGGVGGVYVHKQGKGFFSKFLSLFSSYWFSQWNNVDIDFLLGGNSAYWKDVVLQSEVFKNIKLLDNLNSGDDTLMNLAISKKHKLVFKQDLKVEHVNFGFLSYINRQIKRGFSRTIISFFFPKEKVFNSKDLPVVRMIMQLLATFLCIINLFFLSIRPTVLLMSMCFLTHYKELAFLQQKTKDIYFSIYAMVVLFFRNCAYLLGALKGAICIFSKFISLLLEKLIIVGNLLNPFVPSRMHFFVTKRCNAACAYCFTLNYQNTTNELSLEEVEKITKKIKIMPWLVFTGGEPFMRTDIDEIAYLFYKNCKTRFFVFTTNGYFSDNVIMTVKKVLLLCPRAFITIQVSLDDVAEHNDAIKKLSGCFERTRKIIKELNNLKKHYPKIKITASTVINEKNHHRLKEIIRYFHDQLKIDNHFVCFPRGVREEGRPQFIDLKEYSAILKLLKGLAKDKNRSFFCLLYEILYDRSLLVAEQLLTGKIKNRQCMVIRKNLIVDEMANVLLCELIPVKLGNLLQEKSLSGLLRKRNVEEERNKIFSKGCYCNWGCAVITNMIFKANIITVILSGILRFLFKRKRVSYIQ